MREFLVGAQHQDANARLGDGQIEYRAPRIDARVAVAIFVERGAEKCQPLRDAMADQRAVLADAAGERDGIHSAHDRGVGAKYLRMRCV